MAPSSSCTKAVATAPRPLRRFRRSLTRCEHVATSSTRWPRAPDRSDLPVPRSRLAESNRQADLLLARDLPDPGDEVEALGVSDVTTGPCRASRITWGSKPMLDTLRGETPTDPRGQEKAGGPIPRNPGSPAFRVGRRRTEAPAFGLGRAPAARRGAPQAPRPGARERDGW